MGVLFCSLICKPKTTQTSCTRSCASNSEPHNVESRKGRALGHQAIHSIKHRYMADQHDRQKESLHIPLSPNYSCASFLLSVEKSFVYKHRYCRDGRKSGKAFGNWAEEWLCTCGCDHRIIEQLGLKRTLRSSTSNRSHHGMLNQLITKQMHK